MDEWNLQDKPKPQLYRGFVILFYISLSLLAVATFFLIGNWLDDFLHAPIGIKENPPQPGLFVQAATFAWFPLVLSLLLLGFLRYASRHFRAIPMLLGTVIFICGSLSLIGGILGEVKRQFFEGQLYFTRSITPILYVLFLIAWIGVAANHCIAKWKRDRRVRHGVAGLFLLLAVACGLLLLCIGSTNSGVTIMGIGFISVGLAAISYNANYLLGKSE